MTDAIKIPDLAPEEWTHERIMAEVDKMFAMGETSPRTARDPINQPMINNWTEAIGETDPRYANDGAGIAPPAMAQVWTMYGLDPTRPSDDPLHGTMQIFDAAGFHSVLGTNCDQTYLRDVKVGEHVAITTKLESVVGPKVTGVGEGYFVSTLNTWWVGEGEDREAVATMLFRVLKFKPAKRPATSPGSQPVDKTKTIRPQMNSDTQYFWEGTQVGELRIQKCNACGELRHPPGPMCPTCHAHDRSYVVASGKGTVFSFLVHHAPFLPGKELPATLALIELEEGLRMIGEVQGGRESIQIGSPVQVVFERIDDELTLAQWEVTA